MNGLRSQRGRGDPLDLRHHPLRLDREHQPPRLCLLPIEPEAVHLRQDGADQVIRARPNVRFFDRHAVVAERIPVDQPGASGAVQVLGEAVIRQLGFWEAESTD
jgi:hypothetical protein